MEITTTKRLARVAGASHKSVLREVELSAKVLKRKAIKVELHDVDANKSFDGYEVPDAVGLLAVTKFNIALRARLIACVERIDPALLTELLHETHVAEDDAFKPWHERITYPKPTVQTGCAMVTLAELSLGLPCCVATLKRKLIEAGLGIESVTGFKPTTLGKRYTLPYKRQYVWDIAPILWILKEIESHKR